MTNVEDIYTLSGTQSDVLFDSIYASSTAGYHYQLSCTLQGNLDETAFKNSWELLLGAHDVLRTSFYWEEMEHAVQVVKKDVNLLWQYNDYSYLHTDQANAAVNGLLEADRGQPFLLNQAPLLRCYLSKISADRHRFFFSYHLLILDERSCTILLKEIFSYYRAFVNERAVDMPGKPAYKKYIEWLLHRDTAPEKAFWNDSLRGYHEVVKLSLYALRYNVKNYDEEQAGFSLSPRESESIVSIAKESRITPHIVFLGFWALVLNKFTLENDIVFGTEVAGRNEEIEGVEDMVGLFKNYVPVRVSVHKDALIATWLSGLFRQYNHMLEFSTVALSDIKKWSDTARNEPLFESLLIYDQDTLCGIEAGDTGLHVTEWKAVYPPVAPFTLVVTPGEHFAVKATYNAERFRPGLAESVVQSYRCALLDFIREPGLAVNTLNYVPIDTHAGLHLPFVQPGLLKEDDHIWSRFLAQAAISPSKILVDDKLAQYTYSDIACRAHYVSGLLEKAHVKKQEKVGVFMDSSPEMIYSILGILKSGAAYVPINPEMPVPVIGHVLKDSDIRIVVCGEFLSDTFIAAGFHEISVLTVEKYDPACAREETVSPPSMTINDVACIMYVPDPNGLYSGVQITAGNLLSYTNWAIAEYVRGETTFPFYGTAADISFTAIFTPLLSGNTIVIYRGADENQLIREIIEDNKADIIKLNSYHLNGIRTAPFHNSKIKRLVVSGGLMERELADELIRNFSGNLVICHEYGSVETTAGCFSAVYHGSAGKSAGIQLGSPISGIHAYILDENCQPVPQGASGYLYLHGDTVFKGYLNNENLNKKSFIADPAGTIQKILYRTGDIVGRNEDGFIELQGRLDGRIQLRGHRTEMGAIEAVLRNHPLIHAAVVAMVEKTARAAKKEEMVFCSVCGIQSGFPGITYNRDNTCNICQEYKAYADKAAGYFADMQSLENILAKNSGGNKGGYDCLLLFSGGIHSTHALCKLVHELKLNVLAFTIDNGFITQQSRTHIQKLCAGLQVVHVFADSPELNAIYKDSLDKHGNLYAGYYKVIYTLGARAAKERNIPYIVTGHSAAQLFHFRLEAVYHKGIFDAARIDRLSLNKKKEFFRTNDVTAKSVGAEIFKNDSLFEEIKFVDFYRYCGTDTEEMSRYITGKTGWNETMKTAYLINRLVNEVSAYVTAKEQGYRYNAPVKAWEVRLGLKTREQALHELDEELNESKIQDTLVEIGYQLKEQDHPEELLAAFYVSDAAIPDRELTAWLKTGVANESIPHSYIRIDKIPVTQNGGTDRKALRYQSKLIKTDRTEFLPPADQLEREIVEIWKEVLNVDEISITENIFDIGGHSISIALIFNKLKKKINLPLSLIELYEYPTVAGLAEKLRNADRENPAPAVAAAENDRKLKRSAGRNERKLARLDLQDE